MQFSRPGARVLMFAVLFALAGAGIATYFWWPRPSDLPRRGSPKYLEYQRAFQVGVATLDAGREDLARKSFDRAIELIPEEPAAWANRGLLNLRKNNLKDAEKDLRKAHELAPQDGEIEALLGLLAEKQGRLGEAVVHLRKAVDKQPRDLPSLFKLAEVVSKEGGPDSQAEYQRLMEQILKVQPNNLPVLVERAGAAFRSKDQVAFRDTLERFARLAPGWTPGTKEQPRARETLDELRKAADHSPNEVLPLLGDLGRLLKGERGYSRDKFYVSPQSSGFVGMPMQQFVRLEPTRAKPAAPDRALAFKVEPMPAGKEQDRWDVVRPLWQLDEKHRVALIQGALDGGDTIQPAEAFKPALFAANARVVRRIDAAGPALPFPGGAKAVAPTREGVLAIDWNNDFRTGLLLAGAGGLRFWQPKADGAFADVTDKTTLPADILGGNYYGVWTADIEMDGDLDIIVARRAGAPLVLRNNGNGTFKAIEPFPGVQDVRAFVWADLDNDGAADAVFLDADGKLHVFANDRSSQFSRWPLPDNLGTVLAVTVADVNGDGVFDLVALQSNGVIVRISDQDRRQTWEVSELARWTVPANTAPGTIGLFAEDLDNNGALDLIVAGPTSTHIFPGDDEGKFTISASQVPLSVAAVLDVDRDGRLDLLGLSAEGQPVRAINQSKMGYRWQAIWPLANPKAGDNRVNSFGIGGDVEIRAGALVQKQLINGPVVHFGLGEQPAADVARIVWPNGVPQWEFDTPADRIIAAAQRLSGSCPFLFTYDGVGMRFAGDFMWGTPLGMNVNGKSVGDFLQTTEWLKIRGDHLVPRDGYYDVRVHANLWETDYFDQLALIVVDHPENMEIHVDERFFLTPTKPRLHVTTPAKPVARAMDHHGMEATEEVRAIDGIYLDRAARGRFQGFAEDHWVEIDLGDDAPREGPVLLVARGWLHPTNSSINEALSQDEQGEKNMPQPLSLWVPDGKDEWKVALPALGFPAGKDKTMLIRLDGIDGKGVSRRIRLRTSMEIYWDFLGYATELDVKLAYLHRPEPLAADLRYRGMVEMTQKNTSSPEGPIYEKVNLCGQPLPHLTRFPPPFGHVARTPSTLK